MPTLVWRVVSAEPAVPGPVVSSSGVAPPAVSSKRGRKKRKGKINRAEVATSATKKLRATSKRDLPTGVYQNPTGKFQSKIYWDGKLRHIGTFDTLEQASTAYTTVRKDIDNAKLSSCGADQVVAIFDEAQKKAVEAVGGIIPKNRFVPGERGLPRGVQKTSSGKFQARISWGYKNCGYKNRRIGTFDTPKQASAAYVSVRRDLDAAKLLMLSADDVSAVFETANKKALETVEAQRYRWKVAASLR